MVLIGLKRRDTYDEVIENLLNPKDKIRYPDRYAKHIRGSFQLSQLDGVGMQEYEEYEMRQMKEAEKENALKQLARNAPDTTHVELQVHERQAANQANNQDMRPVSMSTDMGEQTIEQPQPRPRTATADTELLSISTGFASQDPLAEADDRHAEEVRRIRENAELHMRIRTHEHKKQMDRMAEQHAKEMGDINI